MDPRRAMWYAVPMNARACVGLVVFASVGCVQDLPKDDEAAAQAQTTGGLYDPARPSLAYECTGKTLSADEIVALFDPGLSRMTFGPSTVEDPQSDYPRRAALGWIKYSKSCTALTGCSDWSASSADRALSLRIEVGADRKLVVVEPGAVDPHPTTIESGDFV